MMKPLFLQPSFCLFLSLSVYLSSVICNKAKEAGSPDVVKDTHPSPLLPLGHHTGINFNHHVESDVKMCEEGKAPL